MDGNSAPAPAPAPAEPTAVEPQQAPATDWQAEAARWQAESRKWEGRSKSNSDKAMAYNSLTAEHETLKAEHTAASERIAALERELGDLKASGERAETVAAVAAEERVDAELLSMMGGGTADEIRANAKKLAAKVGTLHAYPQVGDRGAAPGGTGMTKQDISKLRGRAQLDAIQQNISLYR